MPYNSHSRSGSSPYHSPALNLPSGKDSEKYPTGLPRNLSVAERNHPPIQTLKRTNSYTSADDKAHSLGEPRPPLRFSVDDAIQELFGSKTKETRSRGGAISIVSSLFACWHPRRKSSEAQNSASKRAAELLDISRRQQAELADKQDTIDMLEWQLEQMQTIAFMENDPEPTRRSIASASGLGLIQRDSKQDLKDHGFPSKQEEEEQLKEATTVLKKSIGLEYQDKQEPEPVVEKHELQQQASDRSTATILMFEMATMRARFAIRSFCKALIKQMEASGYSVLRTLSELEPNVAFTRKEHVVYTLESRINKAFFHCFENDSFDDSGLMQILNPATLCVARLEEFQRLKLVDVDDAVNPLHPSFHPEFRKFCERKTKELWSQFSWNIVFNTTEERDVFTAAFLDAAKAVWLLHRLAFSLSPHVVILRVGKDLEIDPIYVEAVPNLVEGACRSCCKLKVEFLIMPGFRAMDKVIKCQVYQHVRCGAMV